MRELHFKDYFWNGELTSTGGYDCIIQHLNDGKRTCKEIEDFMKARASIEEKYAKELLGLSKKVCGHNEMNLSHLQLAQTMRDEAKKLEDFRERQKEARKKVEQQMDSLHKQRAMQFKKTMESKKTYEQKCRDKEEAEQNMNRNASTSNVKQQEKLLAKTQQAKQNAEEADRLYMHNVSVLGKTREDWQKEHVKACEVFEKQEVERINTLRNMVWTHLNQLSQQCVTSDELHEEVRKSLEQCDIQEDIEHFVNLRRTGDKPPAPVLYENFYSGQRVPVGPSFSRTPLFVCFICALNSSAVGDVIYSTVDPGYSALQY
uniref:Proline-serine-threonine phosphatase-interacting protein 2-like n=1 Tax=Salmo trutta TaxID=8032 RepID=A0A673WQL8_SALTR